MTDSLTPDTHLQGCTFLRRADYQVDKLEEFQLLYPKIQAVLGHRDWRGFEPEIDEPEV
jgi:hypothetical protein